jgi:adenylate cyclase
MRIVRIAAVIGAGVGAVYGVAIAGPGARSLLVSLLISIPIGVIDALLTAAWIAGIGIFLLPRASMRWLDGLPFGKRGPRALLTSPGHGRMPRSDVEYVA